MESTLSADKIRATFQDIRSVSFREKREGLNGEEQINQFLDHLLDLKQILNKKSSTIEGISKRLEALSWLDVLCENDLKKINDLVASARDLYSVLIRQYVALTHVFEIEALKEPLNRFKLSIDSLKEVTADIESVFFFLPQMPDFVETTRELSLIK